MKTSLHSNKLIH